MIILNTKIIEQSLKEVPPEIRAAIKPLSKDKAWAVFIVLLKKENLRFNEIKEYFKAGSPGEIDRILKSLAAAGLIAKIVYDINDLGKPSGYTYSPTNLGKSVIDALFHGVLLQSHEAHDSRDTNIELAARKVIHLAQSQLQSVTDNPL